MERKFRYLDRYLENTQNLLKALTDQDLEGMSRCLEENRLIMKRYEQVGAPQPGESDSRILREKIEAVMKANERCFSFAEKRCQALRFEIEGTDKSRNGVRQYGSKRAHSPKFIDNRA